MISHEIEKSPENLFPIDLESRSDFYVVQMMFNNWDSFGMMIPRWCPRSAALVGAKIPVD